MYTVLNVLAAGSQYLRGAARSRAERDTGSVEDGDADQMTGDAGTADCAVQFDDAVHSHE